jgi:hypothetical protein
MEGALSMGDISMVEKDGGYLKQDKNIQGCGEKEREFLYAAGFCGTLHVRYYLVNG